jgi:Ras-related GTP-binding protein C/D
VLNLLVSFQDDYTDALNKLHLTVTKAFKVNQGIRFEVFIHKVDGLSDDYKMETQRDIHQRANDDLADSSK